MAIRTILTQGDPALAKACHAVTRFDDKLCSLLDDLKETLADAGGIGLAAPQVGILRRAVIVMPDPERDEMIELVNPEILAQEGSQDGWEGCLSLPGLHENVRRPVRIRMRYLDEKFVEHDEEFDGHPARVIQHEYDHIEGKVFTDHLSPLRRNLIKNKLYKLSKGAYSCSYKTKR